MAARNTNRWRSGASHGGVLPRVSAAPLVSIPAWSRVTAGFQASASTGEPAPSAPVARTPPQNGQGRPVRVLTPQRVTSGARSRSSAAAPRLIAESARSAIP